MFYIKTKITEDCEIHTTVTDENVYCICPDCGNEHAVDIINMAQLSEEFDLLSTRVCCDDCSASMRTDKDNG